ncbi:unnamed protein product [Bursaphelenchus xylophilus]|uniref:(pine wood nematode) hypothetical protein n=1 Tax=Bursaphelenchus xylophilus TaxID=6326 RepID=A0A1I7RU93_BURXY|nr:unnamed protein product [Bursaphelenchus xylophilus]CAG9113944.1 unnamed protein product [Bursaphelenchus xylophilus]
MMKALCFFSVCWIASALAENAESEILRAKAKFMQVGMDDTADPCEDFWRYANGKRDPGEYEQEQLNEVGRILRVFNPKHVNTSLETVKNLYTNCMDNPQSFFKQVQNNRSTQVEEIEAVISKIASGEATKSPETYLAAFKEVYSLLFKFGSKLFDDFISDIVGFPILLLPPPFLLKGFVNENPYTFLGKVTDDTNKFLSDIFGANLNLRNFTFVIYFPAGNKTDMKTVLSKLSAELRKTLEVKEFERCEQFILASFPFHYEKILFDFWGLETIKKADAQYRADLGVLAKTVNTTFKFSNVLSENMTHLLEERVKGNRFFGLAHPLFEDDMFYKHFSNLTLNLPYQNRWLNKWTHALRAAEGKDYTFMAIPEPTFNAFHTTLTQLTVIDAPIVKPLFFHPSFSSLLRFSGTGFIVGHELGHDFDESLRRLYKLDSTYTQIYDCLYEYYNSQCDPQMPGSCIDPKNNIDENFADVFGAQMAYLAYKRDVEVNGVGRRPQGKILDGLSDDQLFWSIWHKE